MPFVTSATTGVNAVSNNFVTRDEALLNALELAQGGADNVAVTDIESGEVLEGEPLVAAIQAIADLGEA